MSKRDDISDLYRLSSKLSGIETLLFCSDIIVSLLVVFLHQNYPSIVVVQIVIAIIFFWVNIADDGQFWYIAERARRRNSIENGFDIKMSDLETEEYYNNQSKPSLEKCAMNALESSYYSKEIAGRMICCSVIKSIMAIVILVVSCIFIEDPNLLLVVTQTALSSYVLVGTVMLVFYKYRLDSLYEKGYEILISPGAKRKAKNAVYLAYIVEYEAIKAHYKIRLSTRVFLRNNDKIGDQWKRIEACRHI